MPDCFKEDLAENLRLAEALVPAHCVACGGYHLDRARRRLQAGHLEPLDHDVLVGAIRGALAKRIRHESGTIKITIAGCGDTNLLSLCCVAAEQIASGTARLVDFVVIDRCWTPLRQCEVFADRNDLKVRGHRTDLVRGGTDHESDLVIVHSLLRFMPESDHLPVLASIRRWLRPDGVVVFSHRLSDRESEKDYYRSSYGTAEPLVALLRRAGFSIGDFQLLDDGASRRRVFCLLT